MADFAENLSPDDDGFDIAEDFGSSEDQSKSLTAALTTEGLSPIEPSDAQLNPRPVPRISIDCFCDSPETGASVQRAAEDRRLARTHTTVYMGGIAAAIDHYATRATPNLILVETKDDGQDILDGLSQLADQCDATTKVIVLGAKNDILLYRELIQQGVSDYMITPLTPLQIIDSISGLYADRDASPIGRVVVFVGAKGGVGASALAHNVGWLIAEEANDDVTIVDFDVAFGTAGLDFNQEPTQGVSDALASPERLDDVLLDRLLVRCTDHLNVLTAPAALDKDTDIDPGSYEAVLDVVRQSSPVVIVDLPHVWSAWSKQVMVAADEVVIVSTPDLAGLRNTKNLADLLVLARPNDAPPRVVLNQCGIPKRPEVPAKDFAEAVGREVVAAVPFDAMLFGTAANNGQMLGELKSATKPTDELRKLSQLLTGRQAQGKKPQGLFAKLMGRKK